MDQGLVRPKEILLATAMIDNNEISFLHLIHQVHKVVSAEFRAIGFWRGVRLLRAPGGLFAQDEVLAGLAVVRHDLVDRLASVL